MVTLAKNFLPALLQALLISLLPGSTTALLVSWAWGLGVAFASALGVLIFHLHKLAELARWLENPELQHIPDGPFQWGDVFSALFRLMKHEKHTQQALADALSRFEKAANALPDGVVMLDHTHAIVWCNPVAEGHWGISLERDRTHNITYFIRQPEFVAYLDARRFGEPLILRRTVEVQGGTSVEQTFSVQLAPYGDEQKLLLSRDITQIERLETVRRDFVANVSHELRTPLTVMAGFLETLATSGLPDEALLQRSLTHMTAQSDRMRRLVEDLLTLSRLEDETHRLIEAPIDVPQLIDALIIDAEALSQQRHTLNCEVANEWLIGNREEISSAFLNLISNAIRYSPDGGDIRISWRIEAEQPVFSVQDQGEGIAPEHIPRLTERFYRVDRSRSRATGGTGLGLAIVKHVALRHHAKLSIESAIAGPQRGSSFTLRFPAERCCQPAPKPQAGGRPA